MTPAHILTSLQRACRFNPSARRATLWQVARDETGAELMTPDGIYQWRQLCFAWVIFTFRQDGDFAGVTGDFEGGFKVSVLPDPVAMNPFEMPALEQSFIIRRYPRMKGDPIPEVSMTMQKVGGDAMGVAQTFACREPDADGDGPVFIGPLPLI